MSNHSFFSPEPEPEPFEPELKVAVDSLNGEKGNVFYYKTQLHTDWGIIAKIDILL